MIGSCESSAKTPTTYDKKPGDITGDGFLNGAWHIAQP
jgi:predicted lipoprotein with Yx(FWY)xxD motif